MKRLDEIKECWRSKEYEPIGLDLYYLIARVEKLQAALKKMVAYCDCSSGTEVYGCKEAREALAEDEP